MKNKFSFVKMLYNDFNKNMSLYIKNEEEYINSRNPYPHWNENSNDRNHSKTSIKRKILVLRQELLNLSKKIDEE